MKKRLPPLNWLRAFEASARHLNFTLAATELNLTQAAISQQVKGLESQLGTTLFKRLARGLELTDAGQAYMPVVHEAIERLIAATDELFGQGRKRYLTIRVNLVFFTTWLAARLGGFREQHPDIGLHFHHGRYPCRTHMELPVSSTPQEAITSRDGQESRGPTLFIRLGWAESRGWGGAICVCQRR
uniref:LysR family transcriptional regulator n=1 Tax=Pseudomonas sp. A9 TaxID=665572 RepID=A0A0A7ASM1_9PSED|nr:LysR family transcriptional regulator [Pseudomonas sp. A9]